MPAATPVTAPPIVERLDTALALAKRLGYRVRLEWLAGVGGGGCEIRGQKWLFVDLSLGPREQLEEVLATLRREAVQLRAAAARAARTARTRAESAQADRALEVSESAAESRPGFLLGWRRWYRMIFGSRRQGR